MYLELKILNPEDVPNEPQIIYSEVLNGIEKRHLELLKGGKVGFAFKNIEYRDSFLTEGLFMSLEELNTLDDITVKEITKEEFELIWKRHVTLIHRLLGYLFYRNKLIGKGRDLDS